MEGSAVEHCTERHELPDDYEAKLRQVMCCSFITGRSHCFGVAAKPLTKSRVLTSSMRSAKRPLACSMHVHNMLPSRSSPIFVSRSRAEGATLHYHPRLKSQEEGGPSRPLPQDTSVSSRYDEQVVIAADGAGGYNGAVLVFIVDSREKRSSL